MSDRTERSSSDAGTTLIELLVSIAVIAGIATVLSTALIVTYRQQSNTEGSVEVARWEQALALWLPTDLESANVRPPVDPGDPMMITDDPAVAPLCGEAICSFGSNVLQLEYSDGSQRISYRYGPSTSGTEYILTRVACEGSSCSSRVVLRSLELPDPAWSPGDAVPSSIIDVSVPTSGDTSATVTVTVNGASGVAQSTSSVSITAGGVVGETLDIPTFNGPNFLDAASDCGGPITLVVDESGSIGDPFPVRQGVESFVRAFEGTPTRLQVITMNASANTLGTSGWNRFFDLTEPADVFALVGDATLGSGGLLGEIGASGNTDWEEALNRAYYYDSNGDGDGDLRYADVGDPDDHPVPEMVVFFTDGLPTVDEHSAGDPIPAEFNYTTHGSGAGYDSFSPRGWFRADVIADAFRGGDTRMIGVGVGPAFARSVPVNRPGWPTNSGTPVAIPNGVFLGDVVAGYEPTQYEPSEGAQFQTNTYDSVANDWGDVSGAHVLTTGDFTQLGSALAAIALDECGGTLTVQTRLTDASIADTEVTFVLDATEQATTSRINKAANFKIALSGVASRTVELVPEPLTGSGYAADSWSCKAGGVTMPSGWSQIDSLDPSAGISVTVSGDAAISCTLTVVPS